MACFVIISVREQRTTSSALGEASQSYCPISCLSSIRVGFVNMPPGHPTLECVCCIRKWAADLDKRNLRDVPDIGYGRKELHYQQFWTENSLPLSYRIGQYALSILLRPTIGSSSICSRI
ncbi:hypothetical protein AVEN_226552-1 [Araneus ventricosus]|uniref:Uncharacterized protein n=1 Tax=Araneus ventricosus TaxID=182803 RepID=A0A4Y2MIP6_ARAVE|nr:hypothetical protein AVEN_226552-1 [Araneus ventricosus]